MDALLQLMSCFLNAIMYMILIYYFLPFKLQFKEITILFTILSTNMFLIGNMQRELGDDEYMKYLEAIPADKTHAGYFSIDKCKYLSNVYT